MRIDRSSRSAGATFVLFLCLTFLLVCGGRTLAVAGMPVAGQPVPDFALPGLTDGQTTSLKDLQGKVILLNIWASWCTACKEEMEDLLALQEEYGPRGFVLVAISIDNSPASAVEFMKRIEVKTKKKSGLIVLYDKDKAVSREYRQRSMPTSYLIDRHGKLAKLYPGSFSKSTLGALKAAIEEVLK